MKDTTTKPAPTPDDSVVCDREHGDEVENARALLSSEVPAPSVPSAPVP